MSRPLRFIPEDGSLVEVTCRITQGRYLLRPDPELDDILLGGSSGYRANRQFPGRDLHPLAFETQVVPLQSATQLTSDLPSCRTASNEV